MDSLIKYCLSFAISGIPEYDIPALEPIDIGDLIVAESIPGQGLSITARDIKAYGASNFKLKKLKWVLFTLIYTI